MELAAYILEACTSRVRRKRAPTLYRRVRRAHRQGRPEPGQALEAVSDVHVYRSEEPQDRRVLLVAVVYADEAAIGGVVAVLAQ